MERTNILEKIKSIKDPVAQYKLVYECLDELGIPYRKTNCHKCRRDLYLILLEEVNLIEDASEMSSWDSNDYDWIYIYHRPVQWDGKVISKNTRKEVLYDFCEAHPQFCLKQTKLNFK